MRTKTRLVTYDKPDSEGDVFRRPVRWDNLERLVGFDFQSVTDDNAAGRLLKVYGHSQGVNAVLEFKGPPINLVPVIAFAAPGFREENGTRIIEQAQLIAVSMVARDKAILPTDFFFESDPEPPPWIEVKKVKP